MNRTRFWISDSSLKRIAAMKPGERAEVDGNAVLDAHTWPDGATRPARQTPVRVQFERTKTGYFFTEPEFAGGGPGAEFRAQDATTPVRVLREIEAQRADHGGWVPPEEKPLVGVKKGGTT